MESCVIIRDMALVWQSTGHFKTEEKDCSWDCGLCLQLNRLWYYFLARSPTPTWRNLACIYVKTEYRVFLSFAMNIIERLTLLRLASCLSIHARCHNMFLYLYFILFSKPIWWPLDMNSLLQVENHCLSLPVFGEVPQGSTLGLFVFIDVLVVGNVIQRHINEFNFYWRLAVRPEKILCDRPVLRYLVSSDIKWCSFENFLQYSKFNLGILFELLVLFLDELVFY